MTTREHSKEQPTLKERERWARALQEVGLDAAGVDRAFRALAQRGWRLMGEPEAEGRAEITALDLEDARAFWHFLMYSLGMPEYARLLDAVTLAAGPRM